MSGRGLSRWARSGSAALAAAALCVLAACGSSTAGSQTSASSAALVIKPVKGCGADALSNLIPNTDFKSAHCAPGAPAPQPLPTKTTVTIAMTTTVGDPFLPETLGIEMGEFAKENLNVKLVVLDEADATQELAEGKIDAFHGGITAGVINAAHAGFDIKAVMGASGEPGPKSNDGVWCRGRSTTLKDMVGKKLAARSPGGSPPIAYVLASELKKVGVSLSSIPEVPLDPADSITALENGAVFCAYLSAPVPLQIVNGNYVEVSHTTPVGEPTSALMFGPAILNGHRNIGEAIVRALIRTQDTYLQGYNYKTGPYSAEILKAMGEPSSYRDTPGIVFNYEIMKGTVARLVAAYKAAGTVPKDVNNVTDASFVDRSFVEQAVGRKYGGK